MIRKLFGCVLVLALSLCVWVPAAFAESDASQDTQTEVVDIAAKGKSNNSGTADAAKSGVAKTGDATFPLQAVAAIAVGAGLCVLYAAHSRRRSISGSDHEK